MNILNEQRAREEFWNSIPENTNAAWVSGLGIVFDPPIGRHLKVHCAIYGDLLMAVHSKRIGFAGSVPLTVRMGRNDFQPDISYWKDASKIELDAEFHPPPDFVIEILSTSTEKIDRGIKMTSYADCGVQECWLVDPVTQHIEVFLNDAGYFSPKGIYGNGEVTSQVVPGFTVKVLEVFEGL